MAVVKNAIDLIGNTPIYRIPDTNVYVKIRKIQCRWQCKKIVLFLVCCKMRKKKGLIKKRYYYCRSHKW